MAVIIQTRNDTATNWTTYNPILAKGEMGYESDTGKIKFGDGLTAWTGLAYFKSGNVDSVNGETGTVVLTTSDLENDSGFITSAALTDYEQKATITALSATDSITIADNTIYNGSTQTALTIALWSAPTASSIAEVVFSSGSTATTLSYPNSVKWLGDDISGGLFIPVVSKRYTVIFYYDGSETVGVVKGVE